VKKISAALTASALLLSIAACGGGEHPESDTPTAGSATSGPAAIPSAGNPIISSPLARTDLPLTRFVNVFIGTEVTETGGGYSGNDNPGAQTPFGMVSFGPNNQSGSIYGRGVNGYAYDETTIQSFSLTHLNGPGCRGQGALVIQPRTTPGGSVPTYDHKDEFASPGYYKVTTSDRITTELSATTRSGIARVTFPQDQDALLLFDANKANDSSENDRNGPKDPGETVLDATAGTLSGKASVDVFCSGTWGQPVYFYGVFDKPLVAGSKAEGGTAQLKFALPKNGDRTVQFRIGISSVSVANARLNLETENAGQEFDFDKSRHAAEALWNRSLNAIQLDAASDSYLGGLPPAQNTKAMQYLTQFYTALYRTMGGPTVYSDVNGAYRGTDQQDLGFPPRKIPVRTEENVTGQTFTVNGKTSHAATHYSTFSMWDTYRSLTQLQAMLFPVQASDMMQSLVADAQQCGGFPHWVDGSEDTTPMEGDHAPSVIAGSFAFGAQQFDLATARQYMLKSAALIDSHCNDRNSGASNELKQFYLDHGYIRQTDESIHPTSMTLEMAMADHSIGTFLGQLPTAGEDHALIASLQKRAGNWINVFNSADKTMDMRDAAGAFVGPGSFHEGTEPHYFWSPTYDWTRIVATLGGSDAALTRLNQLMFPDATPAAMASNNPADLPEPSGSTLNSGENGSSLYIGNEPSFPIPWAYNATGHPMYTQRILPVIMKKTFLNSPGGLPGNDDLGATSGWYVWAALGLFPAIPSEPSLEISTPQFSGITVWIGDAKLRIESDQQALIDDVPYVEEMTLNGAPYDRTRLSFKDIAKGGTLRFKLSKNPTHWGTAAANP
jgi:putative alpha-1,2-mannosidase